MNENISSAINSTPLPENDLLGLVHAVGLQVAKSVSIKSQSDLGNWRQFIEIGFCGGEHNAEYGQMVIDYRDGSPHLDQVYNLTYGAYANCRHKVILFPAEKQSDVSDDYSAKFYVVRDLIWHLNNHGARLYLVAATSGSGQAPSYKVVIKPDFSIPKDLPIERIVRDNEFMDLYYNLYDEKRETGPWFMLRESDGTISSSAFVENDDISVDAEWDENGLFYVIKNCGDKNYLDDIYKYKARKLKAMFPDYYMYQRERSPVIVINVTDKPYEWVLYATSAQKKEMGLKIWTEINKILQFMEHGVEDIKLNRYSKNPGLLQI